jgi:hypothetical protein
MDLASVESLAAIVALFALGMRQVVHTGVTFGYVLALLLAPVWVHVLRRFGGARALMVFGLFVIAWGYVLGELGMPAHVVDGRGRNGDIALMLGTLAGIGVVLWARTLMPLLKVTLWYGLGMAFGGALGFTQPGGNPWKFVWAVPIGITLLSLAALSRRRLVEIVCLVALMLLSLVNDSRSYLASFALAALLVLWQVRSRNLSRRASWVVNVVLLCGLGVAVYYLATDLLVSGYLGKAAQERSIAQIQTSGSLLLGGRPELAATIALLRHHPWGFGAGAVPTPHDILVAKTGMAGIGYDPNDGYVERFMFGGHIELHSTFGDLWATYGVLGLAFALVTAVVTIRAVAIGIAHRSTPAVLLFVSIWTLWNIPFSPLYASEPTLLLTLGLALFPKPGAEAANAPGKAKARASGFGSVRPRWR